MAFDLKGKPALVTGAGSGICLAFAQKLLKSGCNVVFADLGLRPEAESVVNKFKDGGNKGAFIKTDVTNWIQVKAAFDEAMTTFGRLDIVCPGAGIFEPPPYRFWDMYEGKDTSSYKVLDINLSHPIRCTQLAIDYFMRQKLDRTVIIHLSSIAAQIEAPVVPIYAASKAGLSHFIRQCAFLEQASNIRVCGVAPANVKTPLWNDAKRESVYGESKGDIWITPEHVAMTLMDLTIKAEPMGGTIWEVGTASVRRVERLNDPGPDQQSAGSTAAGLSTLYAELEEGMKNFGK